MKTCANCGISMPDGQELKCYKYKIGVDGNEDKEKCRFYAERIYEDGELMSPAEHLLISEQTVQSMHMRGVV